MIGFLVISGYTSAKGIYLGPKLKPLGEFYRESLVAFLPVRSPSLFIFPFSIIYFIYFPIKFLKLSEFDCVLLLRILLLRDVVEPILSLLLFKISIR